MLGWGCFIRISPLPLFAAFSPLFVFNTNSHLAPFDDLNLELRGFWLPFLVIAKGGEAWRPLDGVSTQPLTAVAAGWKPNVQTHMFLGATCALIDLFIFAPSGCESPCCPSRYHLVSLLHKHTEEPQRLHAPGPSLTFDHSLPIWISCLTTWKHFWSPVASVGAVNDSTSQDPAHSLSSPHTWPLSVHLESSG